MLSASFYAEDVEVGYLELKPTGLYGRPGGEHEYEVKWTGVREEGDAETKITRDAADGIFDLFAMALVEVEAILIERAVN